MKRKLSIAFNLIILSLIGVVIFQGYWTVNAYHINKIKFDNDIDSAMLRAMDSCKKDYFDSIRVVIIKKLSEPGFVIRIDTNTKPDPTNTSYDIRIADKLQVPVMMSNGPFTIRKPNLDYYKRKITYKGPESLPALITEMSFYEPALLFRITFMVRNNEFSDAFREWSKAYWAQRAKDTLAQKQAGVKTQIALDPVQALDAYSIVKRKELPTNFHQADSIKIYKYFKKELERLNITASFVLSFTTKSDRAKRFSVHHSETTEFPYRYHGFVFLTTYVNDTVSYTKAIFTAPQYAIIKTMLINLILSLLLILLTGFCFLYVYRTIIEQKNLAELKDDFINNMTHELKTPIATITMAIEGLQNFNVLNDLDKTKRYLQTSREQLDRLNQLVTQVLNVAAFENKDIDLHIEAVDLDEMIRKVISSEKEKAAKQVNINYANDNKAIQLYADKLHLNNVLLNLVDNAIKYAGDTVDIGIAVQQRNDHLMISVKDNGIGISPEHIGQVFDKFYRVPTGNVHNVKGTGLGLSYVNYIVDAHGGNILVKSQPGIGSEFIVTLPLANG